MTKLIIELLPYLALAISVNIILGTFNAVFKDKIKFEKEKLFGGIWKSFIVAYAFVGLAIIFDKVPIAIGEIDITPEILMISSIALYTQKGIENLMKILKVDKVIDKPDEIVVIER